MIPIDKTTKEVGNTHNPNWHLYISGCLPCPTDGRLEDLFYSGHPMGRGICRLDPPEGKFLHDSLRSLGASRVLEVGRFAGGSTLLMAAALGPGGLITSVDRDPRCDDVLLATLKRWGWDDRVELLVGDSRTMPHEGREFDALFIDGDHTYDGVRADLEHWEPALRVGGHVFFHDDADRPAICGVHRFCRELEARPGWRLVGRELSTSLYRKER